jgi:hypothetical protein
VTSERRCVLVVGLPRSGTSWLAKCLSFAPGFTYYREPDNWEHVPGAERRFIYLYATEEHDDPDYRRLLTRACAGQIATAYTMSEAPGPLLRFLGRPGRMLGERCPFLFFRKRHLLLKLVHANLNLAWLSAHLPDAKQVYIVRHPCGQFESWKRLGWNPRPDKLLGNPRLLADHLRPFEDLIRSAKSFWERAGAYWAATTYVVHRQTQAGDSRIILAYEWLCGDPVQRFQALYRSLGLSWSPKAERFIRRADAPGDNRASSLNRPTARQIDNWKDRLRPEETQECRRFVDPFGLPYYPGFEPYVASPSGDRSAETVPTQ